MTGRLKIPIRNLDEQLVKDLQEKYPNAELSLELPTENKVLSEADFWHIISLLDWSKEEDKEITQPLVSYLADLPVRHIYDFADILSQKLYTLDQKDYAQNIGEDAWMEGAYFSPDNFLYARACLIANGQEAYEAVLKDATQMPQNLTFESLLYLPAIAYEQKTGDQYEYNHAFSIETYSNTAGWK